MGKEIPCEKSCTKAPPFLIWPPPCKPQEIARGLQKKTALAECRLNAQTGRENIARIDKDILMEKVS